MSQATAVLLGAVAGVTIFLGLPVARMRGLPKSVQGFFNAFATGILIFILWDILSHASGPVGTALLAVRTNARLGPFAAMALIFAVGLGLHNFSEGLAIGQSARAGAIAFVGVLVVGFALHNITEGFGIAAPMTMDPKPASWGFLGIAGLIGGGPTFLGTWIGYLASSDYFYVAFLAVAAGALLYVVNELFHVGRRLSTPTSFAWGLLFGFLTAYATDLVLTLAST
jgi:ZIP family zinc transporter